MHSFMLFPEDEYNLAQYEDPDVYPHFVRYPLRQGGINIADRLADQEISRDLWEVDHEIGVLTRHRKLNSKNGATEED